MPAPVADCGVDSAVSASPPATSGCGGPNINPDTGLSTDYLNHFTEAVMVLELVGTVPECQDDLCAWQPKTYAEHFATSGFSNRNAIIGAYQSADPAVRAALDRASETLNAVLLETRRVVLAHLATPMADELVRRALAWLHPLIARTAAIINGAATGPTEQQSPQAAIDAMFGR
jgi:hypothetical protein